MATVLISWNANINIISCLHMFTRYKFSHCTVSTTTPKGIPERNSKSLPFPYVDGSNPHVWWLNLQMPWLKYLILPFGGWAENTKHHRAALYSTSLSVKNNDPLSYLYDNSNGTFVTTHVKHILKIVFLFFTSWYPMVITSCYRPVNYVCIYIYVYNRYIYHRP